MKCLTFASRVDLFVKGKRSNGTGLSCLLGTAPITGSVRRQFRSKLVGRISRIVEIASLRWAARPSGGTAAWLP